MRFWFVIVLALAGCPGKPAPAPAQDAQVEAVEDVPEAAQGPAIMPIDPATFEIEVKTRDRRNMVKVPGSAFLRGSVDGVGDENERPQTSVRLETFWIDRTPVTVEQFGRCVEARRCKETTFQVGREHDKQLTRPEDCNYGTKGREEHPMNCVSYFGAQAYCRWAEKKLPTEAQWEKAARGSDGRRYPWGNTPLTCERACVGSAGGKKCPNEEGALTCKAGAREPGASPYGALDMAGNVWEWTDDGWSATFYKDDPETNSPANTSRTPDHPVRGGSASSTPAALRTARRIPLPAEATPAFAGFRCALD